ncbi:MAG TPA: hypothetical protein VE053_06055 [Allosphingosinicella sp.]|nr:hypothetical protein [Allosphingosinicella sp.]
MSVKIPQILAGALGAAVYTCLAQRAGAYILEPNTTADLLHWKGAVPSAFDWATLVFVLIWNTKNLVDDFKAFEHPPDTAFHLLWTIFFSALSYTLLALAASSAFRGPAATQILFLYFCTLTAWSFFSWMRRCRSTDRSPEAVAKLHRRGRWIIIKAACAGAVAGSLFVGSPILMIVVVGVIYIYDCRDCGTYSTDNPGGI